MKKIFKSFVKDIWFFIIIPLTRILSNSLFFIVKVVVVFFTVYVLNMHFAIIQAYEQNATTNLTKSEVVNTQIGQTKTQKVQYSQAQLLGLTTKEIKQVKALRVQYKNFVKIDNLTDTEILGIFAKTDQDKQRYAELFVRHHRETTAKVLEFERYRQQAYIDLYGYGSMFDYKTPLKPPKRLSYSIDIKDCDDECINATQNFIQKNSNYSIDLYFINAVKDAQHYDIRSFSKTLGLTLEQVKSGLITINYEK